jgi:hypothetical protein
MHETPNGQFRHGQYFNWQFIVAIANSGLLMAPRPKFDSWTHQRGGEAILNPVDVDY